jgi:hypothetical protein
VATKKKKTPPRGRPALPDAVARRTQLKVLLTPTESMMLDELVARHGITQSDVIRRAMQMLYMHPQMLPKQRWTNEPKAYTHDPSAPRVSDADFDAVYEKGASKTK